MIWVKRKSDTVSYNLTLSTLLIGTREVCDHQLDLPITFSIVLLAITLWHTIAHQKQNVYLALRSARGLPANSNLQRWQQNSHCRHPSSP